MRDDPNATILRAIDLLRGGEPANAGRLLSGLIANHPSAPAYANLALCYEDLGRPDDAARTYVKALALDRDHQPALLNLGSLHLRSGRIAAGADVFARLAGLAPTDARALRGLAHCRLEQARIAEAVELFRRAGSDSEALFFSLHLPGDHAEAHRAWYERHSLQAGDCPCTWAGRRPLRVGYVSPDFRRHTVPKFFEPVLLNHSDAVETYCYSDTAAPDMVTARLKAAADVWRETGGLSDDELEARIRADGIDVLVDLTGHMASNRLGVFVRRPAPVLVGYVGYPHATGIPEMYRITDAVCDPLNTGERLVRLDGCAWAFRPDDRAPDVGPLPYDRNGFVTFGSFNRACKLTPDTVLAWREILARVPGSRLRVLCAGGEGNDEIRGSMFGGDGRVELVASGAGYFAAINAVDVALDTWPYAGMTTTCDCLWQGVPVVTLAGASAVGRTGASLLAAAGLAELAAATPAEYVAAAVALASDPEALRAHRATLRARVTSGALGDGPGVARRLEAAYRDLAGRSSPTRDLAVAH